MNATKRFAGVVFISSFHFVQMVHGQTAIFSDSFHNGSTLNAASIPASSGVTPGVYDRTSYDIVSSKVGSQQIVPGDLGTMYLQMAPSSGGIREAQAIFTPTPVRLTTVGDSVDLSVVFYSYGILSGVATASSTLNIGLFNSGSPSTLPLTTLSTSGLNNTPNSPNATGGVQLWQGYAGRAIKSGTAQIFTRPAQTGAGITSQNQDLLFNNASTSQAYNNPVGAVIASQSGSATALDNGPIYLLDFKITLSAPGILTINDTLSQAYAAPNTPALFSLTGTATGANVLTTAFDSLAFGWRYTGTSTDPNSIMDILSVQVSALIQPVPEPAPSALFGLGIIAWFHFASGQRTQRGSFPRADASANLFPGKIPLNRLTRAD